jgi:hypothetical protein
MLVYQYGIRLPGIQTWGDLPEAVRTEAAAQRTLWNALVEASARWQAQYRASLAQVAEVATHDARAAACAQVRDQALTALKAARQRLRRRTHPELERLQAEYERARTALGEAYAELKAARTTARAQLTAALKDQQKRSLAEMQQLTRTCPAHWSNAEFVLNSFLAAVGRVLKQGGELRRKLGRPREVHFQHRFTGGGVPAARLFGRSTRVQLELPAAHEPNHVRPPRTHGSFRVAGAALPFEIRLHRPLPEGAFCKAVALVGREVVGTGFRQRRDGSPRYLPARWQWSLCISLEVPPTPSTVQAPTESVAAVELGYRVWEEGVRVGVLVDATGHTEALLLPAPLVRQWRYRRELQEEADRLLEDTKAKLRALPPDDALPEEARTLITYLATIRAGGLWRLLRLVEHTPSASAPLLRHWADRSTRLWHEARGVERRYLARRDTLYRTWALRICQQYRKIAIKKLPLKRIAEAEEKDPRLQAAAKYRQLAAVSRLLVTLKHAAAKTGTELVEKDPGSLPRTCAECGAIVAEKTGEVYVNCPHGHRWDQDENDGRTLLRAVL